MRQHRRPLLVRRGGLPPADAGDRRRLPVPGVPAEGRAVKGAGATRLLVRHAPVAADIDARSGERAVALLGGRDHAEGGARLEIGLVADLIAHDRDLRSDDDLLFPVLVFDQDDRAIDAGHDIAYRPVGHRRVGRAVPGPMSFALPAHRGRKDVYFEPLLAAVRLRYRSAANVIAFLD